MKKNMSLQDLLILKLKALYDIELQIIKALPKLAKAASNPQLKQALREHLQETKQQAKRLERAFGELERKPQKTKVEAIRGLIKDGEWVVKNTAPAEALDVALIPAAQYVEHYEMAGYRGAIVFAEQLGLEPIVKLLRETLKEEEEADLKLRSIALESVNQKLS